MKPPTPTALQLQKLLNHAAAGILEEDGIWGPNSQEVWDFWTGTPDSEPISMTVAEEFPPIPPIPTMPPNTLVREGGGL